jgi:hypothetical protein
MNAGRRRKLRGFGNGLACRRHSAAPLPLRALPWLPLTMMIVFHLVLFCRSDNAKLILDTHRALGVASPKDCSPHSSYLLVFSGPRALFDSSTPTISSCPAEGVDVRHPGVPRVLRGSLWMCPAHILRLSLQVYLPTSDKKLPPSNLPDAQAKGECHEPFGLERSAARCTGRPPRLGTGDRSSSASTLTRVAMLCTAIAGLSWQGNGHNRRGDS